MKMNSKLLVLMAVMVLSLPTFAKGRKHKVFSFLPPERGWHCPALFWYSSSSSTSSSSDSCKHIVWIVENKEEKLNKFIAHNSDLLKEQVATGQGVVVSDYAKLMGCSNTAEFSKQLRNNYRSIFGKKNENILPETLNLITVQPSLSQTCTQKS